MPWPLWDGVGGDEVSFPKNKKGYSIKPWRTSICDWRNIQKEMVHCNQHIMKIHSYKSTRWSTRLTGLELLAICARWVLLSIYKRYWIQRHFLPNLSSAIGEMQKKLNALVFQSQYYYSGNLPGDVCAWGRRDNINGFLALKSNKGRSKKMVKFRT